MTSKTARIPAKKVWTTWIMIVTVCLCMLQLNFYSVNFCFPFVSNSLAYIIIPQNNGKIKKNWNNKLTTTYIKLLKATQKERKLKHGFEATPGNRKINGTSQTKGWRKCTWPSVSILLLSLWLWLINFWGTVNFSSFAVIL